MIDPQSAHRSVASISDKFRVSPFANIQDVGPNTKESPNKLQSPTLKQQTHGSFTLNTQSDPSRTACDETAKFPTYDMITDCCEFEKVQAKSFRNDVKFFLFQSIFFCIDLGRTVIFFAPCLFCIEKKIWYASKNKKKQQARKKNGSRKKSAQHQNEGGCVGTRGSTRQRVALGCFLF